MGVPTPVHGEDMEPMEISSEELASAPNGHPVRHRVATHGKGHWEGMGVEWVEPSPPPAGGGLAAGSTLGTEAALLGEAIKAREAGKPADALSALSAYDRQFPTGELKSEAFLARIDALLDLGRGADALALLDRLEPPEFAALPRSNEVRVIRGELLAGVGRCHDALEAFGSALLGKLTAPAEERAMYGRTLCQSRLGQTDKAHAEGEAYLRRFPIGRHADTVRGLLGR
jgi:tetratricopeptide (TPR) repeat protein